MNVPIRSLAEWLLFCERLHPQTIDMGLDRVRQVAQRMGLAFDCPVFTVAGTNGKGSSCAMLESIYLQAGYRTGVYTSPHLVHFEERLRLDGVAVDADALAAAFSRVNQARQMPDGHGGGGGDVSLTFFEFSTLAILDVMQRHCPDVVILEVGLGGRLDAVNVVDADCAILTSIDIDHTALLGDSREAIGLEKAGIMRGGRPVVVSDPLPPHSVTEHARQLGADLWQAGVDFVSDGDVQQWRWTGRGRRYGGLAYPALRGANQLVNAAGVLAALTALRDRLPVSAQAVRSGLASVQLQGRFQIIPGQPTLVLDVAHNPHAAAALAANLDAMGYFARTHAVVGVMADKDFDGMLRFLSPLIDRWYLTDLPTPRAAQAAHLMTVWQSQNQRHDAKAQAFASPSLALQSAKNSAKPTDRILAFGSFYTVGALLQGCF